MPLPKPKLVENAPTVVPPPIKQLGEDGLSGQRRLIRPNLAIRSMTGRQATQYGHGATLTARSVQASGAHEDSSHAEVFYFQKQIQAQTRMVVVLESGEQMEGVIEWYDRYAIKLRNLGHSGNEQGESHAAGRSRVLVYKDCIRYIYKAGDNTPQTMS